MPKRFIVNKIRNDAKIKKIPKFATQSIIPLMGAIKKIHPMKSDRSSKNAGISMRARWMLVIVAALTLEATAIIQYIYAQREIKHEASLRAKSGESS